MAPHAVDAASAALSGIRQGLMADGYDLLVEAVDAGTVRVRIVAGPAACQECLVPKDLMAAMLRGGLAALPEIGQIEVIYPGE